MARWVKLTFGDQKKYLNLDHAYLIEQIQAPKELAMGTRIYLADNQPLDSAGNKFLVVKESPESIFTLAGETNA